MPQILNQINADKSPFKPKDVSLHEKLQENEKLATSNFGVDFGVLNVYTCKMSCKIDKNGYVPCFLNRCLLKVVSLKTSRTWYLTVFFRLRNS